jgi:PAS domain S-box-containing protein
MSDLTHSALAASGSDILSLIGDGVISTDEGGRILLFNRAAEDIFGRSAEEVLGKPVDVLIPVRFHAGHAGEMQSFGEGAEPADRTMGQRRKVLGLHKNGREFPVEATVSRRRLSTRTILTVVVRDISERRRLEQELDDRNRALAASEHRLQMALTGARMGTWEWDLGTNVLEGDATTRMLWGLPEHGDFSFETAAGRVHPDDLPDLKAMLFEISDRKSGEFKREFRIVRPDGSIGWVVWKGVVVTDADNQPGTMTGVTFDITERRRLEEQRQLLLGELNHRMKNMMALVNSVVNLSARDATSVDGYRQSLQGRLGSIAETQSLLLKSGWSGATLVEQLLVELGPFRNTEGTNVVLCGPAIVFEPPVGLTMGLVLHELATNAVKYGALGAEKGVVEVDWMVDASTDDHRLVLTWKETGGPPVSQPTRRGFGTMLVEKLLGRSLGAEVALEYRPEGFLCRIALRLGGAGHVAVG